MSGRAQFWLAGFFVLGVKACDHVWATKIDHALAIQDALLALFAYWRFTKNEHRS
jgi:hypothetical protein